MLIVKGKLLKAARPESYQRVSRSQEIVYE